LTYTLTVVSTNLSDPAVTNAAIDANGIITWTPTESQGPGVYVFTTIVTDTNAYALTNWSLSATNSFTVVVNEVNSAPYWTNSFPTVTMNELTTNTVNAAAQDADIPTNTLTYALTNSPTWAVIDTNSGVITLTPLEADGPTTTNVTVVVTDNGVPQLSATTNFTVVVLEVNTAPTFIGTPTDQTIVALTNLVVTNAATDSDLPTNTLTYKLLSPPTGMTIDSGSGVITWTPTLAQADTTNFITTVVKDNGLPPLSTTNSFIVIVSATVATSGLVSHWPLNEDAGIIAHDVGSANNTGTLTNVGAGTFGWTNGVEGSAVTLTNGTTTTVNNGGFITVGNAASLNFESTNTFSISAWMKVAPGSSQDATIVGKMRQVSPFGSNEHTGYELNYSTLAGTNYIGVWIVNDFTTKRIDVRSDYPVNDGNWHQVAFTYDGSGLAAGVNIYIDGVRDSATSVLSDTLGTNTIQNNVSFEIGSRDDGAFHNFSGTIDDVQVYNTVLSSNNMLAIYTNPGLAIGPVTPPANFTAANVGTNSFGLQWTAPYEVFQVQWTTNLAPPSWTVFPELITSTNGVFNFVDTNSASALKFYQLILLP